MPFDPVRDAILHSPAVDHAPNFPFPPPAQSSRPKPFPSPSLPTPGRRPPSPPHGPGADPPPVLRAALTRRATDLSVLLNTSTPATPESPLFTPSQLRSGYFASPSAPPPPPPPGFDDNRPRYRERYSQSPARESYDDEPSAAQRPISRSSARSVHDLLSPTNVDPVHAFRTEHHHLQQQQQHQHQQEQQQHLQQRQQQQLNYHYQQQQQQLQQQQHQQQQHQQQQHQQQHYRPVTASPLAFSARELGHPEEHLPGPAVPRSPPPRPRPRSRSRSSARSVADLCSPLVPPIQLAPSLSRHPSASGPASASPSGQYPGLFAPPPPPLQPAHPQTPTPMSASLSLSRPGTASSRHSQSPVLSRPSTSGGGAANGTPVLPSPKALGLPLRPMPPAYGTPGPGPPTSTAAYPHQRQQQQHELQQYPRLPISPGSPTSSVAHHHQQVQQHPTHHQQHPVVLGHPIAGVAHPQQQQQRRSSQQDLFPPKSKAQAPVPAPVPPPAQTPAPAPVRAPVRVRSPSPSPMAARIPSPPPLPKTLRYEPKQRRTPVASVAQPLTRAEHEMYSDPHNWHGFQRLSKNPNAAVTGMKRAWDADGDDGRPAKRLKDDVTAVVNHYNMRPDIGVKQRTLSPIIGLKNFNNWVKSVLISRFAQPALQASPGGGPRAPPPYTAPGPGPGGRLRTSGGKVLDMGCGKGGDLTKWSIASVNEYVGVDIAAVSIDQARKRWGELRGPRFSASFAPLDCYARPLSSAFPPAALARHFDVVSMQFCMHYAFESVQKARTMLENVSNWLRPGGVFIGTIPNAEFLLSQLDALPPDAKKLEFGNSVYRIEFEERARRPLFGHRYYFFLQDAVDRVPEYIVYWDNFVQMAAEYGLHPVYKQEFHQVYQENEKHPEYGPLMVRMRVVDAQGESSMDEDQWDAANIYIAFAFEKR